MSRTTVLTPAHRPTLTRLAAGAAAFGAALALSACGSGPSTPTTGGAGPTTPVAAAQTGTLTLDSGWVKAGSGMTAAFGTITNTSTKPVTVVKGSSRQAGVVELHTMEAQPDGTMKMTEKKGGFVIPAGGRLTLSPGGDHIMLMDLQNPLSNGQRVSLDLVATGGEKFAWSLPVRSFAGAEETYAPSMPGMTSTTPTK